MELKQIVSQIKMLVRGITLQNILRWHGTRSRDCRRERAQECRRLQQKHCYYRWVVDVSSEVGHAGTLGWTRRVGQDPAALGARARQQSRADILVQRNGLFCCFISSRESRAEQRPAHAFLAIAPAVSTQPVYIPSPFISRHAVTAACFTRLLALALSLPSAHPQSAYTTSHRDAYGCSLLQLPCQQLDDPITTTRPH